jgi:hypothetical protein
MTSGRHRLLVKVDQHTSLHQFILRITTPAGERPTGVQVWN